MRRWLLHTQVYPPDTAAVGQHMADVAEALAAKGHQVTVFTAGRGYDDPRQRYQRLEWRNGVRVVRLPLTSFGKSSLLRRLAGGISLTAQSTVLALLQRNLDAILTTTTPPIGPLVGLVHRALRGVPFDYWLMDLNPDQAVVLGRVPADGLQVRAFDLMNRMLLRRARRVIALDDAMAERFHSKCPEAPRPLVLPPWAPRDFAERIPSGSSPERERYGLAGKRVVMYGGNHSIAHPLDDLVTAARQCDPNGPLRFVFMGGGLAKRPIDDWIEEDGPTHIMSLPYQPLEKVHAHLAIADVHVVVVGPNTVGIVHPSKIYGAMAVGRPILVIGPETSTAAQIVRSHDLGWIVANGDTDGLDRALNEIAQKDASELEHIGVRAHSIANSRYSRAALVAAMVASIDAD